MYQSRLIILLFLSFLFSPFISRGYSVLTHEALIDANWDKAILPLLKLKYPGASAGDYKNARAFAYGGAVSPDLGYYPGGSKLFTNLIHYVRSGDFIEAVLRNAHDLNEYAFALGVMCHYYADRYGHGLGINLSVPVIYPEMEKKFGDTVTYADNRISHVRTEFGFDVLQTARGNYATTAYHDFIGFQVSKELLIKAFQETYGLDVNALFGNFDRAVSRFRWIVMNLFPFITKTAWARKKDEILKTTPTATSRNFIYRMQRKKYNHDFGSEYKKPGFFAYALSFLIRIAPKVGPLRVLKFKIPNEKAERLFIRSFDTTGVKYSNGLAFLSGDTIQLGNINFDTGKRTAAGEYKLADEAYADWLLKLQEKNYATVSPVIRTNIIAFYANRVASPQLTPKTATALRALSAK